MTKGWGPDGAPNGWVAVKTVIKHNAINDFATVDARHLLFIFSLSVEIWIDGELGLGPTTIVSCELSAGHAFFSATRARISQTFPWTDRLTDSYKIQVEMFRCFHSISRIDLFSISRLTGPFKVYYLVLL